LLQLQERTSKRLQQSNDASQISEEKLRLLADNAPGMTASFDWNLYCGFANRRYRAWRGPFNRTVVNCHIFSFAFLFLCS
jgi:hypothetical protein